MMTDMPQRATGPTPQRVVRSDVQAAPRAPQKLRISLRVELFLIVATTSIAMAALALFTAPHLGSAAYSFVAMLFLVSALVIDGASSYLIVGRVRSLAIWLETVRVNGFKTIPPIGWLAPDEVGMLGRSLASLASQLKQASEREDALIRARDEILTIFEHQLRTPLTELLWSLEHAQVPIESQAAVLRVRNIVESIIDAARIQEGKFEYVFAETDLPAVIQKSLSRINMLAQSRHITISFEHSDEIPHVRADAERIEVVMNNLLTNAIDYTPDNGSVRISVNSSGETVTVGIADSGIGISTKDLGMIFTRMYRGDNARKMHPDGSGLGLYIVKNILDAHSADIKVHSLEGRGTQISFTIPTWIAYRAAK